MTVCNNQSLYVSAPTESQVQSTEEKSSTSNGNNKLFPTTAIDGSQDEDGQECGIQGGTNLDQQTELPKKSPYSSKEKGEQNCKKQQRKQGEAQNETDPKRSFKGKLKQLLVVQSRIERHENNLTLTTYCCLLCCLLLVIR